MQQQWQRCQLGARRPAEPLTGPTALLMLGGEISHWEGSEGKVSAPVIKAAGQPGVPVVLSTPHSRTTPPRADIAPVGLRQASLTRAMSAGKRGTSLPVVDGEMLPVGVAAQPGWKRDGSRAGAGRAAVQPRGCCRLRQQHPQLPVFCLGEAEPCEPAASARPRAPS